MGQNSSAKNLPRWTRLLPFLISLACYGLAYAFQITNLNPVLHLQSSLGIVMALWWGWPAVGAIALSTLSSVLIWLFVAPSLVFHPAFTVPELLEIILAWSLIKDRFKNERWEPSPRAISRFVFYAFGIAALIQAPVTHMLFYILDIETLRQTSLLTAREFLGDILGGLVLSLPLILVLTPPLQRRQWSLFLIQGLRPNWLRDFDLKFKLIFVLTLALTPLMSLSFPLEKSWYILAVVMLLYAVLGGLQTAMLLNVWVVFWYIAAPAIRGEIFVPDIDRIQSTASLVTLTFSSLLAASAVTNLTEKLSTLRETETELKRARDQAQEASRAKSEFLARMSHEIRTPLNSVLGMLELLKETQLNSDQERYLALFSHAGENLKALINDLLDFSKIEAKSVVVENISYNIHSTLRSVFEILQIKAEEKGLTFELNIDPHFPLHQWGDPTRLRQVLFNLIGNALKFTTEGEIQVSMRLNQRDPHWFVIEIKDTGIGIPREKQSDLFNPFFQADTSTTRKYGGTGLGLIISKNLVEIMGGFIELKSLKGRGTTFKIVLPHRPDFHPQPENAPASLLPLLNWPRNKRYKLLITDDSEDNRILLIHYLKGQPFDCDEAANGQECYEKAKQTHYDLIFMDIQMPVMSGYRATELIRYDEKIHNKPATTIIALTATAVLEDLRRTLKVGCNAYLVKPVKKKEILEALKKHLLVSSSVKRTDQPSA